VSFYRTLGWLVVSGLAAFVALSSYVISNEVKAPAAAYATGFPPAGIAKANLAFYSYGARAFYDRRASVTTGEVALARLAYRTEPLSSTALSMLLQSISDSGVEERLLELASDLTRRNSLLNEKQIDSAAARGDDAAFFQWLSRSMLTNNDLLAAYVGAMAQATAKDGAVEALTPVVGPRPRWADHYWEQVAKVPASTVNAAKLRVAVAGAPWLQTEIRRSDQMLALALTNRGEFDAAFGLYRGLGLAREKPTRNLLFNGTFWRQPKLPPFDWQLAVSGTLGSSIDPEDKSLRVSAIAGARGYAARQLVSLRPGNYQLGWSLSASMPFESSTLWVRLNCAETGVKASKPVHILLKAGSHSNTFAIPPDGCNWYWLSIDIGLPDTSPGFDAVFQNISLTSAKGEGARVRQTSPAI